MRLFLAMVATVGAVSVAAAQTRSSAQPSRKADAHQHGQGKLDIAIEGTTISMALEVPADDIVGFEHVARTKAEKAKVEAAKAQLADPLVLFGLAKSAGCTVQKADVKFEAEATPDGKDGHTEVKAEYTVGCTNIADVKAIEFLYFKAFRSAEGLNVNLAGPTGQTAFAVTREKPRLELPAAKS
jgi:hypothetical protein